MRETGVGWGGKETILKKFGNKIKKKEEKGGRGEGEEEMIRMTSKQRRSRA